MLAAACLLAPAAAQARETPPGDGNLSPRLAALAQPSLPAPPSAESPSLAGTDAGSLVRDGNRVVVEVRFDDEAALRTDALRAAGAEILNVSRRYQTVTAAVKPADLADAGTVRGVGGVTEVLAPVIRAPDCGGAVTSEGDVQLAAALARSSFGVDGSGVTVGILSDSFDRNAGVVTHAAGDVGSGDLPGPGSPCGSSTAVGILDDSDSEGTDEGRAMAQIVHDLAPGASIDFATALPSETAFAEHIRALWKAGAQVIVDDVGYFEEPFFQDGPVAVAVNEVTAAGVSYFSAAGNDNLFDSEGRGIASWEAPEFRQTTCPPALKTAIPMVEHCMNFNPAGTDPTFGITVSKGSTLTVDLQWQEPWYGVKADLDAYLLNAAGDPIKVKVGSEEFFVDSAKDNVSPGGTERPVEVFEWKNSGASQEVQLAIDDCFETCNPKATPGLKPRLKVAMLENGHGVTETQYPSSSGGDTVGPTLYGHAAAPGAIAVAAVPYGNNAAPEVYSSRGPATHYFGPVLGTAPAKAIAPASLSKPDLAATDCGVTTFFASFHKAENAWRFCGTSAAAPHAAAIAALIKQADPGASAAQVRTALTATARPVGAFGANDVGAGLIDADAAVRLLALPPTVTITKPPLPLSRDRRPTIEFTANRPVAFSCTVDGSASQPCASPFTVPTALADGNHGIAVSAVDLAGRSGASGVASFAIDTKAPRTSFAKHPPKLIRTHHRKVRAKFRFRSNEAGVSFVCKVDRGLLRFCGRRISRRFGAGKHVVQVRARDRAGNVDRTPAVFHFRVKRLG